MLETELKNISIDDFIARLASASPTPGGGGAAALVAAQAAALAEMVAALTLKNKKYESAWSQMKEVSEETEQLRREFLSAIDQDAEVFNQLMTTWKLPKENTNRQEDIILATYRAAEAPLEVAKSAAKIIGLAEKVLAEGVKSAASDGELAILFAVAAIRGSLYNVKINLQALPESERTKNIRKTMEQLLEFATESETRILGV